ncbi:GFA family protein [Chachezhania sediminis]|uniref:GFA family protein n=1 Tax=Chachezhania sediminis TaxID=2599291 RepID=UPI00131DCA5E|nr:GFA family protein [Chachezhania sediminis]
MICTTGGCLCGAVRYTLVQAPDHYDACHCGMCRKFSGGVEFGFDTPPDSVTWEGAENIRTYRSSDWAERGFCGTCGSSLFYRTVGDGPAAGFLSMAGGSLDSLEGLTLTTEIYIDSKPSGHAFAGDTKKMTEAQVMAAFGIAPEGN